MRLIRLSDFVLEKNQFLLFKNSVEDIRKYAEFLQQELTLSMFLPLNEDGKPSGENTKEVLFENVTFQTIKSQEGVRFYSVGDTQIFNLTDDYKLLYWHHYTIESLLSEFDETIMIKFGY